MLMELLIYFFFYLVFTGEDAFFMDLNIPE